MDKMKIGVCYYPEHWPESGWKDDAERMREIGISVVRVGEFAWQQLEPRDGELHFEWLHEAIEIMHTQGLRIVLGTPTATPPKWLVNKHPDMLAVDFNGKIRKFGSRRHYCFSSSAYIEECQRITELVAKEFGQHPSLIAWQTDNEYGCHNTSLSYSVNAQLAFRRWCSNRYQTIDALNQAWGNAFWSMGYQTFDEIDLPDQTVTEPNPSHQLAFWQFSSEQIKRFNKAQTDIIRKHSPGIPVSHNFMGNFVEFDHRLVAEDLDIATWDSYPLGFLDRDSQDAKAQQTWMRTGHPDTAAFHHDLYRGLCNGRWWVMEQQPGPVNWAPHNPSPLPGMARLWGLEAFAHGAETVSYFRWRQAPFAQEMMHTGLLLSNGDEDWAAAEVRQLRHDIQQLSAAIKHAASSNAAETDKTTEAETAIVFDYASDCALRIQKPGGNSGLHAEVGGRFDPLEWTQQAYSALRQLGLNIDIVGQHADLSDYKLVVVACAGIATDAMTESLSKTDALVLILPRSGSRSEHGTLVDDLPPGPLNTLIPLQIVRSESMPQAWREKVTTAGGAGNQMVCTSCDWREQVRTELTPAGIFNDGWGFLYSHHNIHYLNAWLEADSLFNLMSSLADEAGLCTVRCAAGFRLRRWKNLVFAINYGPDVVHLTDLPDLPERHKTAINNQLLIGKPTIYPTQAAVWAL